MYEIIVRLSRAVASRPRLRILSYLAHHGETMPTVLQRDLRLPLNVVSHHLRTLSSVGLISSRRSAVRCYYDFSSPYPAHTLSGEMSRWLRGLLQKADNPTPGAAHDGRAWPSRPAEMELHSVIFEAATAFTDLRRLQVLEYLASHDQATGEELATQLKMSDYAVCRQTMKLRRRALLSTRRTGRSGLVFQLATRPKTPVHGRMLEIVRSSLKTRLRTS
jgi:DNA-binding transcriptional ArsR family regulator